MNPQEPFWGYEFSVVGGGHFGGYEFSVVGGGGSNSIFWDIDI